MSRLLLGYGDEDFERLMLQGALNFDILGSTENYIWVVNQSTGNLELRKDEIVIAIFDTDAVNITNLVLSGLTLSDSLNMGGNSILDCLSIGIGNDIASGVPAFPLEIASSNSSTPLFIEGGNSSQTGLEIQNDDNGSGFIFGLESGVPRIRADGSNDIQFLTNSNVRGEFKSTGQFNLITGNEYQINDVDVLSSDTLGSGVVNASLTANTGALVNTGILTTVGKNYYYANNF